MPKQTSGDGIAGTIQEYEYGRQIHTLSAHYVQWNRVARIKVFRLSKCSMVALFHVLVFLLG